MKCITKYEIYIRKFCGVGGIFILLYGLFYIFIVLPLNFCIYKFLYLWIFVSMNFCIYEFLYLWILYLWIFVSMNFCIHEFLYLQIFVSMNFCIYDLLSVKYLSLNYQSSNCVSKELPGFSVFVVLLWVQIVHRTIHFLSKSSYKYSIYKLSVYELSVSKYSIYFFWAVKLISQA